MSNILYKELSDTIIGIAFKVHNKIGCSLPEHCYNRALYNEFVNQGISVIQQQKFDVYYNDEIVGHFFCDLIVDNKIVIELKSDDKIYPNHLSQLLTYLSVTRLKVGYVINYGVKSLQFKRLIL